MQRAEEIVRKLTLFKEVLAIILFGSQLHGNARLDSDVDLAAITKTNNESIKSRIVEEGDEVVQVSHFNTLPLEIQFRAITEGRVLFCRNKNMLSHYTRDTIVRYLDFAPVLHRFYRRVLENV